jgi:hypothetical protein
MDSDKKRSTDVEYQYAGEELGDESLQTPQQKRIPTFRAVKERLQQMLPKKGKYRVLLFVGFGIYILYKFLDVATPPAKDTTDTHEKIAAQQLSKPSSEKIQTVKAAEKPIEKLGAAPAVASPLPASADNSNTPMIAATEQPKAMTQIQVLREKLDQMNHSVNVLESSLLNLTNSVISLSDKINLAEKSSKTTNYFADAISFSCVLFAGSHDRTCLDRVFTERFDNGKSGRFPVRIWENREY